MSRRLSCNLKLHRIRAGHYETLDGAYQIICLPRPGEAPWSTYERGDDLPIATRGYRTGCFSGFSTLHEARYGLADYISKLCPKGGDHDFEGVPVSSAVRCEKCGEIR